MSPTVNSTVPTGTRAGQSGTHARQAARRGVPALRLVAEELWDGSGNAGEDQHTDAEGNSPRILIVGPRAHERMQVRQELAGALAPDTAFAEAGNVWEVLQRAPRCGVVMLAGALPDVSARTLTELLGRRHPWLPVVVLDPPHGEAQTDTASV